MSRPATFRQLDLLRFISGFQQTNGFSPSFEQMAEGIGAGSKCTVFRLLAGLERRGLVRKLYGRARAVEILANLAIPRAPDGAPLFVVPGFGGE